MSATGDSDPHAAERAADLAFLGLEAEPSDGDRSWRGSFDLTPALSRHDGKLYGGTAIAVATALIEAVSRRRALWTTVQYVSGGTSIGDRITCRADVLAAGRNVAQVRVQAHLDGEEVFGALGAAADPKPGGLTGTFDAMPAVLGPDDSAPFEFPLPEHLRVARSGGGERRQHMELRVARAPGEPERPLGSVGFWARVPGRVATPPLLAYLADMVPMSIAHASGRMGGGTSLDNTIRFGAPADDEWVLLHLLPHLAVGGFGHGTVLLWSRDGRLLGTGSQTASMIVFD